MLLVFLFVAFNCGLHIVIHGEKVDVFLFVFFFLINFFRLI
jgi:hypothetical protein